MKRLCAAALIVAGYSINAFSMSVTSCGNQMILSGAVERGDFQRIKSQLSENPNLSVAVLRQSNGGDAETGYEIGAYFRAKGITTYLSGYCRSSCSRMFLGGTTRYFTDDFPNYQTSVGFHSNYNSYGQIASGAQSKLHEYIRKYSDGKADAALVDRWVNIPDHKGFAHFFHPSSLGRQDGISVLLCNGSEPSNKRWSQCEKISGHDALSMGVITSLELMHSCDADSLPSKSPAITAPSEPSGESL